MLVEDQNFNNRYQTVIFKEFSGLLRVWLFTFSCVGFLMIIWLLDACLAALLPNIRDMYEGVTVVQAAQMITLYNVGFIISSVIFGPLGDVLKRFLIVLIAASLFLVAGIAFAYTQIFETALILRFCAGFCGGILTVNIWSGLIHEVPQKHFNTAIGLMAGTRAYSMVLGLPLVMKMVEWIGWTTTFIILGSAVVLPLIGYLISSRRPESSQKNGSLNIYKHFSETLRIPGIAWSLTGFFLVRLTGSAPFVFISLWLFDTYKMEISQRALLMLVYGVGEILGSWLSVFIITKLGARNTFNLGVLGTFAFVSLLVFVELPMTAIAVGLLLLSLSDRSYSMAFWRIYIPQDRTRTGTLSSLGNVSFAGAIAIVTGLGTPLVESFGWKVAGGTILVSLVIGAAILRACLFTPPRIAKANEGW